MIRKVLYIDLETTGGNPRRNGIVQLSGIIEIDNKVVEEFDFFMRTFKHDEIEPEALNVTGLTLQKINEAMSPHTAHASFIDIMRKYIDKYDKSDKFYPCAYNGHFDYDFLCCWFYKLKDEFLGSWVNHRLIDPLVVLRFLDYAGIVELPNYKLKTVCEYCGIEINAHDAMSDIRATREVVLFLRKLVGDTVVSAQNDRLDAEILDHLRKCDMFYAND